MKPFSHTLLEISAGSSGTFDLGLDPAPNQTFLREQNAVWRTIRRDKTLERRILEAIALRTGSEEVVGGESDS